MREVRTSKGGLPIYVPDVAEVKQFRELSFSEFSELPYDEQVEYIAKHEMHFGEK